MSRAPCKRGAWAVARQRCRFAAASKQSKPNADNATPVCLQPGEDEGIGQFWHMLFKNPWVQPSAPGSSANSEHVFKRPAIGQLVAVPANVASLAAQQRILAPHIAATAHPLPARGGGDSDRGWRPDPVASDLGIRTSVSSVNLEGQRDVATQSAAPSHSGSSFHSLYGAVEGSAIGAGMAAHYQVPQAAPRNGQTLVPASAPGQNGSGWTDGGGPHPGGFHPAASGQRGQADAVAHASSAVAAWPVSARAAYKVGRHDGQGGAAPAIQQGQVTSAQLPWPVQPAGGHTEVMRNGQPLPPPPGVLLPPPPAPLDNGFSESHGPPPVPAGHMLAHAGSASAAHGQLAVGQRAPLAVMPSGNVPGLQQLQHAHAPSYDESQWRNGDPRQPVRGTGQASVSAASSCSELQLRSGDPKGLHTGKVRKQFHVLEIQHASAVI